MQPTIPTPGQFQTLLLERLHLSPEEQESFLHPKYELGDIWQFEDMLIAVERIQKAIVDGEHVGIYADYDCDGIPGAVVLVDFFKVLGIAERVHVYIPDRHDEGYGVSIHGIQELQKSEVTLMLTVDVGITALAEVAYAQEQGIDCIVTDHHAALATLPPAIAVVHPQKGTYENKNLCGAAVAFCLVRAFLEKYGESYKVPVGWEKWLLDLVGFATLSDMVPLIGENRTLAAYGLTVMRKTRRIGLRTMFAANGLMADRLTETDLTFTVAPRLNAASRIATPMLAFELLATSDVQQSAGIVKELDRINTERKSMVARIVKEAHAKVDNRELPAIVVLGDPSWRPAVLGLVANKLLETYNRSFFVWGEAGDGTLKGSCRMIVDHHAAYLFQALPEGVLLHAGGHQAAGGFAVMKEKVHLLEDALNAAIAVVGYKGDTSGGEMVIEMPLAIATVRHYEVVRRLAPFGVGNPEPSFLFSNVEILSTKMFGKAKDHLECVVKDDTSTVNAFMFFASKHSLETFIPGAIVSFTATLDPGYRGGVRLRIHA